MTRPRTLQHGALALIAVALLASAAPSGQRPPHYLFSSFRDNGQDGLHLAHSRDGLKWAALYGDRSFLTPTVGTKLMRDPSIARGPDGMFHMVWTTGWWDRGIGVAHSKDLIAWSEQKSIPVMAHEPDAVNCWAPELFYDDATKQFLIFWSTTIPGQSGTEAKRDRGACCVGHLRFGTAAASLSEISQYPRAGQLTRFRFQSASGNNCPSSMIASQPSLMAKFDDDSETVGYGVHGRGAGQLYSWDS